MLHYAFPSQAATATLIASGPMVINNIRIVNTTATEADARVYLTQQSDADDVQAEYLVIPNTAVSANGVLSDDLTLDVPENWYLYAYSETAHTLVFWVTSNV